MIDKRHEEARGLADRARRLSDAGDHIGADRLHRQAIELCREVYAEEAENAADGVADPAEHQQAAHELADQLGRLAGSLRRASRLAAALVAYREGAFLEREWRLEDTYNRTNVVTLEVLLDPTRGQAVTEEAEEVLHIIRRQVEGPRRRQWWAWADLGVLSLLTGRHEQAMWAYERYLATGPRPVDVESTLSMLRELRSALDTVNPDRAKGISDAIHFLSGC